MINATNDKIKEGTISLEDLNSGVIEQRINSAFSYGEENNHLVAKVTITDTIGNEIKSIYYNNQETFDTWVIYSSLDNSQNFRYFVKSLPIFIHSQTSTNIYEETIEQGNVIFEIIIIIKSVEHIRLPGLLRFGLAEIGNTQHHLQMTSDLAVNGYLCDHSGFVIVPVADDQVMHSAVP